MSFNKNQEKRLRYLDNILQEGPISKNTLLDKLNAYLLSESLPLVSVRTLEGDIARIQTLTDNLACKWADFHQCKLYYYKDIHKSYFGSMDSNVFLIFQKLLSFIPGLEGFDEFKSLQKCFYSLCDKYQIDVNDRIISFDSNIKLLENEYFSKTLDMLYDSIVSKRVLRIMMDSFNRNRDAKYKPFIIHPYHLKEYANRWYLIGYCEVDIRKEKTFLPVDRMMSITKEDTIPYRDPDSNITYANIFNDRIGVGGGPLIDLVIKVKNESRFRYFQSKKMHSSQQEIGLDDKGCHILKFQLVNNKELHQKLRSFGAEIEVMEPLSLRESIAKSVNEMNDLYNKEEVTMGRKVFLSVLGTGFYGKCKYTSNNYTSEHETRFIQQATLEYLDVSNWSSDDKILFALTTQAKNDNWNKSITKRHNTVTGEDEDYRGLQAIIEDMHLPMEATEVPIPNGMNEDEMWMIFTKIYNELEEGDELYIDLTHSFRYIPMLVLVLCNYAGYLKKTTIKSITYGNYEARKDGIAPIIDLLPLTVLQDWTFKAANFTENGRIDGIKDLCDTHRANIIKKNVASDESKSQMCRLSSSISCIDRFIQNLQFSQGANIIEGKDIYNLSKNSSEYSQNLMPQLQFILEEIMKSISIFKDKNNFSNIISASDWCLGKKLYQQSITLLMEGMITYFCKKFGIDEITVDERDIVTETFHKVVKDRKKSSVNDDKVKENHSLNIEDYCKMVMNMGDEVIDNFNLLGELRNYVDHAGIRKNRWGNDTIKTQLSALISYFKSYVSDNPLTLESKQIKNNKERLLINLSNHPYCNWSIEQKEAAAQYGECKDMPFPVVDPDGDEQYISELADNAVNDILSCSAKYSVTVHIMGEMNTCFTIVQLLQKCNITCIASSSVRDVIEKDGVKESVFHFSRFRQYI